LTGVSWDYDTPIVSNGGTATNSSVRMSIDPVNQVYIGDGGTKVHRLNLNGVWQSSFSSGDDFVGHLETDDLLRIYTHSVFNINGSDVTEVRVYSGLLIRTGLFDFCPLRKYAGNRCVNVPTSRIIPWAMSVDGKPVFQGGSLNVPIHSGQLGDYYAPLHVLMIRDLRQCMDEM